MHVDFIIDIAEDDLISDWIKRSRLVGRIDNYGTLGLLVTHRNTVDEINNSGLLDHEITEKQLRLILTKAGIVPYPHS